MEMVPTMEIVKAVTAAGGVLSEAGGKLRVDAPTPLPDHLRLALREHKAEVLEFLSAGTGDDDLQAGVDRLAATPTPSGFTPERWRVVLNDATVFLRSWRGQARKLGWSIIEVLGCHRRAPLARHDAMGLVLALNGDRIVALTEDHAVVDNGRGARLNHRRRPTAPVGEIACIWELTA